ncbi:hypothetical protein BBJ28_00006329 [Nothophytophthora sp. Chile5]|nr:hypothetical protein BBJ28_00006329 [Nothophytophthora sp. Chile5]
MAFSMGFCATNLRRAKVHKRVPPPATHHGAVSAQSQRQPNPISTSTSTTTPTVVPPVVKKAIASYLPRLGRAKLPPRDKVKSLIYKWGVRLVNNDDKDAAPQLICLADEGCRQAQTAIALSSSKTSKAALHLKEAHGLASERTQLEALYVLLETLRIVNYNLPFTFDEFAETLAIRDLAIKQEMCAAINANVVRHAVVELYTLIKHQVESDLAASHIGNAKCFSIVGDFWTSKSKKEKYLGMRIYMMDKEFQFNSILLSTRHVAPLYCERDGGIRGPFQRWHGGIVTDFGIRGFDIFSPTSDGGADVKWMMCNGLKLNWECGASHLLLWNSLVIWYSKHQKKARRENQMPPPAFPLSRDKMDLIRLLSLLKPITELNAMSQAEWANQSDVLLFLYKLRVPTLDVGKPLLDCHSTAEEKTCFQPEDLSIIGTNTRTLLAKTLHINFFQRYTNCTEMNRCSYVFEMQLLLHPNFKNPEGILKKMIERCNLQAGAYKRVAQRHYAKMRRIVMNTVRKIMIDVDQRPREPLPTSEFVDITQRSKIPTRDIQSKIPSNVRVNVEDDVDDQFSGVIDFFSSISIDVSEMEELDTSEM